VIIVDFTASGIDTTIGDITGIAVVVLFAITVPEVTDPARRLLPPAKIPAHVPPVATVPP
jgi:hypothetical protein